MLNWILFFAIQSFGTSSIEASCQELKEQIPKKSMNTWAIFGKPGRILEGFSKSTKKRWAKMQSKPREWKSLKCDVNVSHTKFMPGLTVEKFVSYLSDTKNWKRYYPNVSNIHGTVGAKGSNHLGFKTFGSVQKCNFSRSTSHIVEWKCESSVEKGGIGMKVADIHHRFSAWKGSRNGKKGIFVASQECQQASKGAFDFMTEQNRSGVKRNKRAMVLGHGLQLDALECALQPSPVFLGDEKTRHSEAPPRQNPPGKRGRGLG